MRIIRKFSVDDIAPSARPTKRIMREFRINEISAVDRPAQAHATAVIMKRDEGDTAMDLSNVDLQALAHETCLLKAAQLRKADPKLTIEQAYAKIYCEEIEIRKGDRYGAIQKFNKAVARTEPLVEYGNSNDTGLAELEKLAAEQRRRAPWMTVEQAFAAAYTDPQNAEIATRERKEAYTRMLTPGVRTMA